MRTDVGYLQKRVDALVTTMSQVSRIEEEES
jgi:hypothetical protein